MLSAGVGSPSGAVPYSTRVNLVSVPIEGRGRSQETPGVCLPTTARPHQFFSWTPSPQASPNTIVVGFTGVFNL